MKFIPRHVSHAGLLADAVQVMANASSRILSSCSSPHVLRTCITGPLLLHELKDTQQYGYSGWLDFDENGDRLNTYTIYQVKPLKGKGGYFSTELVARYDPMKTSLTFLGNISWLRHEPAKGRVNPQSQCSADCKPRQKRALEKVNCCWTCVPCRANEYATDDSTECVKCRDFFWPSPNLTSTTCVPILPATAWTLYGTYTVLQIILASLCLVAAFSVFVFFLRHRHRRVIKASSRELSFLMLLAIVLGYTTVIMLLAPPNDVTCRISFILFCSSFTLLYGSLFVRTVRIFRIFRDNIESTRRPRMTGCGHQVVFSLALLLVQVSLL